MHGALSWKDGKLGGLGAPEGVRGEETAEEAVTAGVHGGLSLKNGEQGDLAVDRDKDSSLSDKRLTKFETFSL